jgi:hypothetical protein
LDRSRFAIWIAPMAAKTTKGHSRLQLGTIPLAQNIDSVFARISGFNF